MSDQTTREALARFSDEAGELAQKSVDRSRLPTTLLEKLEALTLERRLRVEVRVKELLKEELARQAMREVTRSYHPLLSRLAKR